MFDFFLFVDMPTLILTLALLIQTYLVPCITEFILEPLPPSLLDHYITLVMPCFLILGLQMGEYQIGCEYASKGRKNGEKK